MRCIFRGKRLDNDEWEYGYYVSGVTRGCIKRSLGHNAIEVDDKTVGQNTGLRDKNGKKIYEGDIVEFCTDLYGFDDGIYRGVVKWGSDGFKTGFFIWEDKENEYFENSIDSCELGAVCFFNDDFEVIGNIHDNLELLEMENK